jgi:CarboxypepD_reg-like domain
MRKNKLIWIFLIVSQVTFSQIKGVVKDSISGNPIPYVNILVEDENIRTTSEENGEFTINPANKNANLIFSALGFENKKVSISNAKVVLLSAMSYELDDVFISNRKDEKQIEIGKIDKSEIYQAFENGPTIDVKFFPYQTSYKKTQYVKQVTLFTDSRIEDATIKLHFYKVDTNGFPGEELMNKDIILTLKKGVVKNKYNLSKYNLTFPRAGLFVGFEKLLIQKNTVEKTQTNTSLNTTKKYNTYLPYVLYGRAKKDFLFTFTKGKWIKQDIRSTNSSEKAKIDEPAINLILTN